MGTGEVMTGDSKLVGISQRRTREYARFQSMCHLRWRPELVAAMVAPLPPTAGAIAVAAQPVDVDGGQLRTSLEQLVAALH